VNIWNIRSASSNTATSGAIEVHFGLLDGKLNSSNAFESWRAIDLDECPASLLPESWPYLSQARGALVTGVHSPLGPLPCVVFNAEDSKRACMRIVHDFNS
jgi:hypothetical protein